MTEKIKNKCTNKEKCEYGYPEPCGEAAIFTIYMEAGYFPTPTHSCDKHIYAMAPFPNCTVRNIETRQLFQSGEDIESN